MSSLTFPLEPSVVEPYIVAAQDYTLVTKFRVKEQRRYKSLRITGTAEALTSDTKLVCTAAFTGYASDGLLKSRVAVVARNSVYAITVRVGNDEVTISKIFGNGSFAVGDAFRIAMVTLGFRFILPAMTLAEKNQLETHYMFHQTYETFPFTEPVSGMTFTVKYAEMPQLGAIDDGLNVSAPFSCAVNLQEVP